MSKFETIYDIILHILENDRATRNCDLLLIRKLTEHYYDTSDIKLNVVLDDIKKGNFPAFTSIFRLRREAQKLHPELKDTAIPIRRKLEEKTRLDMLNFQEPKEMIEVNLL